MLENDGYELVRLACGAFSVHSLAHAETFHPVIGPVAEAQALYIRQTRLIERLERHAGEFVIWDVGLGAAANVLAILEATRGLRCELRVMSFDRTPEPLAFALKHRESLGYFGGYEHGVGELLGKNQTILKRGEQIVEWRLHLGDFPHWLKSPDATGVPKPHLILFDAYSPARNPEMWTLPLFEALHRQLDPERACLLPTYSRSTLLRVSLLLAGFFVGAGEATGEKEETTIAANRLDLVVRPLDRIWLKRARNSTSAEPLHEPIYRQRPLTEASWQRLIGHPQFAL